MAIKKGLCSRNEYSLDGVIFHFEIQSIIFKILGYWQSGDRNHSNALTCNDIDECKNGQHNCPVKKHIVCENEIGSYQCVCASGFTGSKETNCTNINECDNGKHTCSDNTTCKDTEGSFECITSSGSFVHGPGWMAIIWFILAIFAVLAFK